MSDKVAVVIEVIRGECPLAPAPPALEEEADLDAILRALKPEIVAEASASSATSATLITLDLDDATELTTEPLALAGDATSAVADPSLALGGGLLDLGLDNEHTQADAIPMQSEEPTFDESQVQFALVTESAPASEAPMPLHEKEPEAEAAGLTPIAVAASNAYAGAGEIVEVETEGQREAREEQERRQAARELAEFNEKAEAIAKAEEEAKIIKAARAEMNEKKRKRKEAREARKLRASGGSDNSDDDSDGDSGSDSGDDNDDEILDGDENENDTPERVALHKNVQERVRGLSAADQQKLARNGDQRERVVLERLYGKNVWEGLLRNPKLTPPEAARIARMGALPVPLIEIIVSNRSWLSSPQVRRALFTNPRLKREMLDTVLRATPKPELKVIPKQTAYPHAVRQAAKRLLK